MYEIHSKLSKTSNSQECNMKGTEIYLDIIIERAIVIAIPLQQLEGPLILEVLKLLQTIDTN